MPTFCLVPNLADKFKKAIISGEIDIEKLSSATSQERANFFNDLVGERNAKEVNALFESKLLLKNQQKGLVTWAKQVTGMKPELKNSLVDKIQRMENILSPENESSFLQALASKRLGTDISIEEANKIVELSKKITSLEKYTDDNGRIKLGKAKMDLADYVNSLNPTKASLSTNIAGIPRSLMASLDLSAPLNQGWGMVSRKQFWTNLKPMFKAMRSEDGLRNIQADILTRPSYKSAKKAGLRITDLGQQLEKREEAFMSTLVDKIPGVSASQRAYTGFLNKLRMDVYDDLVKKAGLTGEDIGQGSKVLEDIANVVNNFTGGAKVGKIEGATPALNAVFFSPRKIKSTLEILNPVNYVSNKISPTARKAAVRNLLGSLAATASVIKLADMLGGDNIEIEEDPRSSDFGKIKIGDTRLDISGGNANYATLVSRLLSQSTKSTTTGAITPLGTGYGQKSGFDVLTGFGRNKLSPVASLIIDSITGSNAIGEKKTISQSAIDRFKPMFINSAYEIIKNEPENAALIIPALFGAGVNTYSVKEDWNDKETKEINQFKEFVSKEEFKLANDKYNNRIKSDIGSIKKSEYYKKLTPEEQLKEISDIKSEAKKDIFKEYKFKPKKALPKKS